MNKFSKILSCIFAILLVGVCLGGCGDEKGPDPTPKHSCQSVCLDCGKCLDKDCQDDACTSKCQGHEVKEETKTYKLKVMSFNLDQAWGGDASKRSKVLNEILDVLPDLLGVQEETPAWKEFLEESLESEGYKRIGSFRSTSSSHAYYGNREASAIYYNVDRFKLEDSGTFWLSPTPDVEGSVATAWDSAALFPRVCTYVVVKDKRSGEKFAYFNTHFSYEAEALRNESAKLIVKKVAELGLPSFVSGDLNFASNEETDTYTVFTEALDDSRTIAQETETSNTFHAYGYGPGEDYGENTTKTVPIDYIFSTKGDFTALSFDILKQTGAKGNVSDWYSDHFAIVALYEYSVKK